MIDLCNVTKRYGKTTAIDNMSLSLNEKSIYCLLGRNGAGKTTLMNLISGKLQATSGNVTVSGKTVTTLNMPENVRYIEAAKPQFNMRISELLVLAQGVDEGFDMEFALRMAEKFRLDKHRKYNALSFGMKTMVTTIISLASNEDIILLDEPVLGFDAVMRAEFYELLSESFEAHPRIILISTHLIDEVAGIAEHIIAIDSGRIMFNYDINTIIEKSYKISGPSGQVEKAVAGLNVIKTEMIGKYFVAYIFDRRITVPDTLEIGNVSLQDLFVKMAEGEAR